MKQAPLLNSQIVQVLRMVVLHRFDCFNIRTNLQFYEYLLIAWNLKLLKYYNMSLILKQYSKNIQYIYMELTTIPHRCRGAQHYGRFPLRIDPLSKSFRCRHAFSYKLCLFFKWHASLRIGPTRAWHFWSVALPANVLHNY